MLSKTISGSERIDLISDQASLLFSWTNSWLDDFGRGECSVSWLKKNVVPGRDWTRNQVEEFRDEIIVNGLMIKYSGNNGKEYWYMPTEDWVWHQRGSWHSKAKKESNIPKPPNDVINGCSELPKEKESGDRFGQGKGREGKLREGKEKSTAKAVLLDALTKKTEEIYNEKTFTPSDPGDVIKFKNKALKLKYNIRCILHAVSQWQKYNPWKNGREGFAYCWEILNQENENFNAQDYEVNFGEPIKKMYREMAGEPP